jgi:hypothetical protein
MVLLLIYSFACIHLLESLVFPIRIASIVKNKIAAGYSYSLMISTITRFLMLIFMPLLGYMIDNRMAVDSYLAMASLAILVAALFTLVVYVNLYLISDKLTSSFGGQKDFSKALFGIFTSLQLSYSVSKFAVNWRLMAASTFIYSFYATSIFASFFFALMYHEYRVTISLMSGVTNGVATIALTFFVEPYIARAIDMRSTNACDAVHSVFLGRLVGICLVSQGIIAALYFSKIKILQ